MRAAHIQKARSGCSSWTLAGRRMRLWRGTVATAHDGSLWQVIRRGRLSGGGKSRVRNAVAGQALLQEPNGDGGGAHALAKSRIERAGRVGERDKPAERCPPALIMPPSVPRRATGIHRGDRLHTLHHLVHGRDPKPL